MNEVLHSCLGECSVFQMIVPTWLLCGRSLKKSSRLVLTEKVLTSTESI